jgi:hypothetical protein
MTAESGILPRMRGAIALLLALAVAGGLASPTTATSTRAALRLGDESPLAFAGSGFRPGEHVRVVAISGRRAVRSVTAGSGGRFAVRFTGMNVNACRGASAIAVGDRGSRATYKRAPGQCPWS